MTRSLAFLSAAALLASAVHAQCLGAASGTLQTLVPTGVFAASDEGRTAPAVPFGFTFPMAGALPFAPGATHAYLSSNGELYLTNGTYGIFSPIDPVDFGITWVGDWRGSLNASPRIAAWTADLDFGNGGVWGVYADTSVANQVTFTWSDLWTYSGGAPSGSFSFGVTLYSTGVIDLSYSGIGTFPASPFASAGVSIGNQVGTGAEVSQDLSTGIDSGSLGLLFEEFFGVPNDLENRSIRLTPNGLGGFTSSLVCTGAYNLEYGTGCYDFQIAKASFYEHFTDAATASTTLTGNAMSMVPTINGYTATWLPGGATLYVPPSVTATALVPNDDGNDVITPSVAFPGPNGPASQLTISHNGIITLGGTGNHTFDYTPTGPELALATGAAFYSWSDFRDNNTVPVASGVIKYEEVGNTLHVTFENVDHWTNPQTTSPSTLQFQLDLATGTVNIVWVQIDPDTSSTFGDDHLIGYTDAGTSTDPGSMILTTGLPITTSPDIVLESLALSASPSPVITLGGTGPSVPVTWTVSNVVDIVPPFGIGLGLLLFSVAPIPGGLDAGFLDMPGCNLNIASLDVLVPFPGLAPVDSLTLTIPQPLAPGLSFYSQALSLFAPGSLPNGQNLFGGLLSNGVQSYFNIY